MRIFKFIVSFLITLLLLYFLDNRWLIKNKPIPPLGKFLDPFHGFWQNIESTDYTLPANLKIAGLKEPVTIALDSLMIPHIFANNDEDLYLAQGYITAMHRLWQMEIQTHAAAGRVSEIVGEVALDNDRSMRRLGMVYGAQHSLKEILKNPTTKMMVEKYTEGINAYIQTLEYKDLAFEYKLLKYNPEPWTTLKCALLMMNMANTLSMGDKDMQMTNALKLYGLEVVDLLYPDNEEVGDPIVDHPEGWKFKSNLADSIPLALPDDLIQIKKIPPSNPTTGSNNWAVHGSKTLTGSPILCNDPHLNLSLPSLWYVVQLHAPGINTMGASLPGAPGVVIGYTDSVAWGVTNAQRDLVDWFQITFKDRKKDRYLVDGKWLESKKVVETITIRDQPTFYDTVIYTQYGPVTYDDKFHAEKNRKDYAFRWTAHDASNEYMVFYKLNRAKNYTDYMDALSTYASPPQNFVFASVQGDVAMRIQGKYPARRKNEGRFVLNGSKSINGWQAFIPTNENIMYKNPARGFISSANQYPVDKSYPYYITANNYEAYRNRRINKVLGETDSISVTDMMNLQNDTYNLKAAESLPLFLSYIDSITRTADEEIAYQILKSWNYYNTKDSEGASYYEAWWDVLIPLTWDELEKEGVTLSRPTTFNTIKLIKEKPELSFFDIQSTPAKETAGDVIRKAFRLSVLDIHTWMADHKPDSVSLNKSVSNNVTKPDWGNFKDSRINHLLKLDPLSFHVRAGGNHDIVNAHSQTHGPSWKMIVSLEQTGIKAWGIYPGGQSGNPGSRYYSNMIDPWVNGKYFSLQYFQKIEESENKIISQTHLIPANK